MTYILYRAAKLRPSDQTGDLRLLLLMCSLVCSYCSLLIRLASPLAPVDTHTHTHTHTHTLDTLYKHLLMRLANPLARGGGEEEDEEDLFVFIDTIEGPRVGQK
jgi:hypothetical protein